MAQSDWWLKSAKSPIIILWLFHLPTFRKISSQFLSLSPSQGKSLSLIFSNFSFQFQLLNKKFKEKFMILIVVEPVSMCKLLDDSYPNFNLGEILIRVMLLLADWILLDLSDFPVDCNSICSSWSCVCVLDWWIPIFCCKIQRIRLGFAIYIYVYNFLDFFFLFKFCFFILFVYYMGYRRGYFDGFGLFVCFS